MTNFLSLSDAGLQEEYNQLDTKDQELITYLGKKVIYYVSRTSITKQPFRNFNESFGTQTCAI